MMKWASVMLVLTACSGGTTDKQVTDTSTTTTDEPDPTDTTTPNAPICQLNPCGGDLAGTWLLTDDCGSAAAYTSQVSVETELAFGTPGGLYGDYCPVFLQIEVIFDLTMTFDEDAGALRYGTFERSGGFNLDQACVEGSNQTCDGIADWYNDYAYTPYTTIPNTPDATYFYGYDAYVMTCEDDGALGCDCTFEQAFDYGLVSTYFVSNANVVIDDVSHDYCVRDDQMWFGAAGELRQSAVRLD